MIFLTTVNGIPCQCRVTHYSPGSPGVHTLSNGDPGYPPQPEELEFDILDRRGRHAPWLEKYITPAVEERISEEHHIMVQGELGVAQEACFE